MNVVTVVGLGPGPAEWLTAAALNALRRPGVQAFLRTSLHPAAASALAGRDVESFDTVFEQAASLDEVHTQIVDRLATAVGVGPVVYAVPGDGVLGEAIVARLLDRGVSIDLIPGIPEGVGSLGASVRPAQAGAQLVDATELVGHSSTSGVELNARWLAVVSGLYSRQVASDVKLALLRVYTPDHQVTVTRHAGLPDCSATTVALSELDRGIVQFDHLTQLVVPPLPTVVPSGSPHGLRAIVAQLRAPDGGCPWDLQQTHASLIPYVVEEAYEVAEAIEDDDIPALADELGDVLLQVYLHAEVADQSGEFDFNDVVRNISAKLIRRHPHVFGDVEVSSAADVVRNWDALKARERVDQPPASALTGVPRTLPALSQAVELGRKAVKAGFDWPDRQGALDKALEEIQELLAARTLDERRDELGDVLWMLANLASRDGIDPELALRSASRTFTRRFAAMERIARERGWDSLKGHTSTELLEVWSQAKRELPGSRRDG